MHLQIDDVTQSSIKVKMSSAAPSTLTLSRADAIELAIAITMSLGGGNYEEKMKKIEDSRPIDREELEQA